MINVNKLRLLFIVTILFLSFGSIVYGAHDLDWNTNLSVEEAISKFEKEYGVTVLTPKEIPFEVKKSTGSFNNNHMNKSDLDLEYRNNGDTYLKIFVKQNYDTFEPKLADKEIILSNNVKGIYCKNLEFAQAIDFKKDDIVYSVHLSRKDKFSEDDVKKIVESMF
jgi:hypothetical protein